MKILYGVVGDGMGHAIRSSVLIPQLLSWGHELRIMVSGRAHAFLKARFPGVEEIWGMAMVYGDNEVQKRSTAVELFKGALSGLPKNVAQYFATTESFAPDLVISDFETFSALYGHNHRIPVISVDNIQAVRRLWHPPEVLRGKKSEWRLAKSVIKAKIPHAYHYLVSSFFEAEPRKSRTTLVPPILRDIILQATPSQGEHVLVYQTSPSFVDLPESLKLFPNIPFKIYGMRRELKEPVHEDNLLFCPFSEQGFVDDLASCRGVIASAGFTLLGEAVHLRKPVLATPIRGQFEQVMNARYIEHLGWGLQDEELDEFTIRAFLNELPRFQDNLQNYQPRDNSMLFEELLGLFDRIAAGL
ncbi:MAG: glycosyltransferase family protein [Myxococcota bacterium]|jgi:uncharacterized protein (TIGR00661 family)|nr:glycosyltransferase family protein [Myxococcota bacterium]